MQNRNPSSSSGHVPFQMPQDGRHVTPAQVQQLMNQLSPADRERVESVLHDKSAMQKLLSTPQAQALMKKFGGGK